MFYIIICIFQSMCFIDRERGDAIQIGGGIESIY